jgi:thiol:disulfide interchange protein DsbA
MSRALSVAAVIVAVVCAAFASGCSRDPEPQAAPAPVETAPSTPPVTQEAPAETPAPTASEPASVPPPMIAAPAANIGPWVAGQNYVELRPAQPTNVGSGKVEVLEIFWYGCPHCYSLDPVLESWKARKPANVEFTRVHVMWGPVHKQQAHLFYAIQALGRQDLHRKAFDTIQQGNMLAATSDPEARAKQAAWAKSQGVSEKDFLNAYDSMSVAMNLQRAEDLTRRYAVQSVPMLVVNGRYTTDVSQAGGQDQLLTLITDLAASERR